MISICDFLCYAQRTPSSQSGLAQCTPAQPASQTAWTAACQASARVASVAAAALLARHVCAAAHQAGGTSGTGGRASKHAINASVLPRSPQATAATARQGHSSLLLNGISVPGRRLLMHGTSTGQSYRATHLPAVAPAQSWFSSLKESVKERIGITPPAMDPTLPSHWEQQLLSMPLGKRRALERWAALCEF